MPRGGGSEGGLLTGSSTSTRAATANPCETRDDDNNGLNAININASSSSSNSADNDKSSHSSNLFTPVVLSILATETAERFAYFGFRAVLVLYFVNDLWLDENTAISCFAYTTCLANFSPLAGAVLAESQLGRFRTILCFGCLYALGLMILTYAAFIELVILDEADAGDGDDAGVGPVGEGSELIADNLFVKRLLTFVGLLLVCTGTGGIKPCVNIFGADQVALRERSRTNHSSSSNSNNNNELLDEEEEEEIIGRTATTQTDLEISSSEDRAVREFFNFFYFCINVGAVTSFAVIPIVKAHFGFGVSFLLPTIFMCVALVLFYSRRKEYIYRKTEGGSSLLTTFRICFQLVLQKVSGNRGHQPIVQQDETGTTGAAMQELVERAPQSSAPEVFQDEPSLSSDADLATLSGEKDTSASYQESLEDAQQALKILPIMAMLPIFWMLYDQQGSVWTLQASRMTLHGLEPEQLNLLNPLEIMIFIPLFDRIIYPAMEAHHWNIAPLRRMGWGMVLASLSFVVSGLLEHVIEFSEDGSVNVLWQIPQITILAVGEIFLSVTGLEYAYSKSPDRLKGFIMATYLLTVAVGDLLGGILYSSVFRTMDRAVVMYVCATFMLLNRFAFGRVVVATQQEETASTATSVDEVSGAEEQHQPYSDHAHDANKGMPTDGSIELVGQATHVESLPTENDEDDDWLNVEVPKLRIV